MGALQGKDWCIKKTYTEDEANKEVQELSFTDSEFPWEVRNCDICSAYHVWRDYMREHG